MHGLAQASARSHARTLSLLISSFFTILPLFLYLPTPFLYFTLSFSLFFLYHPHFLSFLSPCFQSSFSFSKSFITIPLSLTLSFLMSQLVFLCIPFLFTSPSFFLCFSFPFFSSFFPHHHPLYILISLVSFSFFQSHSLLSSSALEKLSCFTFSSFLSLFGILFFSLLRCFCFFCLRTSALSQTRSLQDKQGFCRLEKGTTDEVSSQNVYKVKAIKESKALLCN